MLTLTLLIMLFALVIIFKLNIIKSKKVSKIFLTTLCLTLSMNLLIGCSDSNQLQKKNSDSNTDNQVVINNESLSNGDSSIDSEVIKTEESTIHFIDTGNSDAILISGEKNILIDGADNDDEKSLVSYIEKQGVTKLDYVIATHPDADHVGGLDSVIKNITVENLLVANGSKDTKTYRDFINAASNKGLSPSVPLDGKKFNLGSNSYMMLFNTNGGSDANEQSLVTLYVNGNDKVLFMGDAGKETEEEILNNLTDVDLIKVGHHGSRYSTTTEFLNKVNPEFAVITVGADNSYGHPHKEAMERLQAKGVSIHRTDQCGTIIFTSTGNGLKTNCSVGTFDAGKKTSSDNSSKSSTSVTKSSNNNTATNNEIDSTNITSSTSTEEEKDKTVFLSATGSKYHSINNCGTMNPNKAREVLLSAIQGKYQPCSKCN